MSIYQFVVEADFNEVSLIKNVHHYDFDGYVPSSAELQEAVDALDAAYKSNLQATFSDFVDFNGMTLRRVDIGDLPSAFFVPTAGLWSGTAVGVPLPPQLCALVTWRSQTAFPRSTRAFLFPWSVSSLADPGVPVAGHLSNAGDLADDALVLAITGQTDAVKVAVQYGGSPRVVTSFNQVLNREVGNLFRTQRRRVTGVGT